MHSPGVFSKWPPQKYEKLKMGYSIPQILIITDTGTLSLNICFEGINYLKKCVLIA